MLILSLKNYGQDREREKFGSLALTEAIKKVINASDATAFSI